MTKYEKVFLFILLVALIGDSNTVRSIPPITVESGLQFLLYILGLLGFLILGEDE